MPTSYTSFLGLALPATGELGGTWGTVVNDYLTQYVDAAVAGAQTISGNQTAVTLSTTNGGTLTQAGSGATGSAQYAIINCTGNPAGMLTVTAPATSKVYLVINATSTNQSVKVVGVGPTTGVTVAASKTALIAWNGADFQLIAVADVSTLQGLGTGVATALGNNANGTGGFATINGAATFTNKRIDPRVSSTASASSVTPDIASFDQYCFTALSAATLTINAPIGTPVNGNKLIFRILDDGTPRALSWDGTYTPIGVLLPTTTTANKMTYVGCLYNAANTRWDVIAVTTQI